MKLPVLIEPMNGSGFRARIGEPFGLSAEGSTLTEALRQVRALLDKRLAAGALVVPLEVPDTDNPWVICAGMFKDGSSFDDWIAAIQEYRRQVDADPDTP